MVDWARKLGPQEPTYTLPLEISKKAPRVWLEKAMRPVIVNALHKASPNLFPSS